MYPIVKREKLADKIYLMDVRAPRVAQYCEPGQFVIVKIDETGERIPLTICDYDREAGTITIVFQVVGASTERMAGLKEGDEIEVKLLDIDPKTGKFKLSHKVLLPRPEKQEKK